MVWNEEARQALCLLQCTGWLPETRNNMNQSSHSANVERPSLVGQFTHLQCFFTAGFTWAI